jgi:hypothetical protein
MNNNTENNNNVYLRKNSNWIKFGCFLTGYNCKLLRQCSEASYKKLKKFTSAILIIALIWFINGFLLSQNYFKTELWQSIGIGILFIFLIIQIERQIILSVGKSSWVSLIRIFLGIIMAVVGAVIIDQIFFQEDIEKEKIFNLQKEVNKVVPQKTVEIKSQIKQLDSILAEKTIEQNKILTDINKKPVISVPTFDVTRDSAGNIITQRVVRQKIINPKRKMYEVISKEVKRLQDEKNLLNEKLFDIRNETEKELRSRKGFLDELDLMYKIVKKKKMALYFWFFWFLLLFLIELFVVTAKTTDSETDYEFLIQKMNQENKNRLNAKE